MKVMMLQVMCLTRQIGFAYRLSPFLLLTPLRCGQDVQRAAYAVVPRKSRNCQVFPYAFIPVLTLHSEPCPDISVRCEIATFPSSSTARRCYWVSTVAANSTGCIPESMTTRSSSMPSTCWRWTARICASCR